MRSFRFLLSRRWALFAVAIAVIGYATWWLGEWQFGRLDDRQSRNAIIRANEEQAPAPVDDVLAPGGEVADSDQWRLVTATGTYDESDTVIVRYRTRDGASGVDVVVPLVTAQGTALIVDRGWMPADNAGERPADVPAPPSGEVTVTAWVRADGSGDSVVVEDQTARAISSEAIGEALGREVYGGFVDLRSEDPAPSVSLEPRELPELDNGPHFFYGLQWWFFGILATFGFFYLMYDEWRGSRRGAGGPRPDSRSPTRPRGERKPRKVRQSNHPYVRARQEQEAREAEEAEEAAERAAAAEAADAEDDPAHTAR